MRKDEREEFDGLTNEEIDALVAEALFEGKAPDRLGVASYSGSWDGFGLIFARLREMGFGLTCGGHPSDEPSVHFFNHNYSMLVMHRDRGAGADTLPRAAAIAALVGLKPGRS